MVGVWIEGCSQRGIPDWPYGGQGWFWIGWRNMKKDPCEYQTHRDGRQSRALSYLSQAGLCTHHYGAHSYNLFKRLSGDILMKEPSLLLRRMKTKRYARHMSISGSHCASRRAGQKDFLHYPAPANA